MNIPEDCLFIIKATCGAAAKAMTRLLASWRPASSFAIVNAMVEAEEFHSET